MTTSKLHSKISESFSDLLGWTLEYSLSISFPLKPQALPHMVQLVVSHVLNHSKYLSFLYSLLGL